MLKLMGGVLDENAVKHEHIGDETFQTETLLVFSISIKAGIRTCQPELFGTNSLQQQEQLTLASAGDRFRFRCVRIARSISLGPTLPLCSMCTDKSYLPGCDLANPQLGGQ